MSDLEIITTNVTLELSNALPAGGTPSTYVHVQAAPASVWTITHNLGQFPSVTVVDSLDRVTLGDVVYTSANVVTLTFSAPFSGRAFLN